MEVRRLIDLLHYLGLFTKKNKHEMKKSDDV